MKKIPVRKIKPESSIAFPTDHFRIRNLKDVLQGKDMNHELHRHDFFFMLVLKKGKGKHEIDFVSYPVNDHTVFFIRPGQVHQLSLKRESEGYLIEFSNDFFTSADSAQLVKKAALTNCFRFREKEFSKILFTTGLLFEEYSAKLYKFEDSIQAGLRILFIELIRKSESVIGVSGNNDAYVQKRLELFLELVERDFSTHKQVAYYANAMNLSPYQLNAITKSLLGKTASEAIDGFILLEAKRYLLATGNLISQIAYQLGYEDVSYFVRFFKKHTGYTPEGFRNNFR